MPDQLRALRKHLGLTQAALAEALGISRKTICEHETGRTPVPRERMLAVLCLVLEHDRPGTLAGLGSR